MYESHFGFNGPPFQLVPDPSFYFGSKGHSNALAFLKFGAHQGEGFIVVTGEIGAGKTTLVRTLLDGLDRESVVAAPVISSQLEPGDLPLAILMAFGVATAGESKSQLLGHLEAFLTELSSKGRRALLIVDEAQNLPTEVVEELRLLTNFQLGKTAMLQVFLIGQPELRTMLQSKAMDQMRQRVTASSHLGPLDPAETRAYVEHRLRRVGWVDRPKFELDAFQQLHRWTGGIPRRINRLCNRLLLSAFLDGKDVITAEVVEQLAKDLRAEIGETDDIEPLPAGPAEETAVAPEVVAHSEPVPSGEPIENLSLKDVIAPEPEVDRPLAHSSTRRQEASARPPAPPAPLGVVAAHEETLLEPAVTKPSPTAEAARIEQPAPVADARAEADSFPVLRSIAEARPGAVATMPVPAPAIAPDRPEGAARREPKAHEHLICLVDSAANYVKARALARVLADHPKLPAVMTVHTGSAEGIAIGEGLAGVLPGSPNDVHLDIDERGGAAAAASALVSFDAVLKEHAPSAVIAMGSSDNILSCCLLAHKSGIAVLRNDAGRRRAWAWSGEEMNAVLLERFADISYINDLATYYTLYRVGIATDRVLCVGDLADNVVHFAGDHTVQPDEVLRRASISTKLLKNPNGYALATTQIQPRGNAKRRTEELVARLSVVGKHLTVLWALDDYTLHEVNAAGLESRLAAADVVPIPSLGYLDGLDLLRRARCLIAGSTGECLDEALSLGVQTLVLGKDIVVPVKLSESAQPTVAQGVERLDRLVRDLLGTAPTRRQATEKWDGGPAKRIAVHLESWLSKHLKAKARHAPVPRAQPLETTAKQA